MTRHGINKYDDKDRRAMRRRNHVALDLHKTKYRQQRQEGKKKIPPCVGYSFEEDENENY